MYVYQLPHFFRFPLNPTPAPQKASKEAGKATTKARLKARNSQQAPWHFYQAYSATQTYTYMQTRL